MYLPIFRSQEEENDSGHADTETSAEEADTADSDNEADNKNKASNINVSRNNKANTKNVKKLGKGDQGGQKQKDGKQKTNQDKKKAKGTKQSSEFNQQRRPKQILDKSTKEGVPNKKKFKKEKKAKGPSSDSQPVQKPENEFRLKKAKLAKSLAEGKTGGKQKKVKQEGSAVEGKKVVGFKTKKQNELKKKLKTKV